MKEYNFLGRDESDEYFKRAYDELRTDLTRAVESFKHIVNDVYQDFDLAEGIFEMFDLKRWPKVARAIERKVKKFDPPSFLQA